MKPKVMFCTPCYGGMAQVGYMASMLQLADVFRANDVPISMQLSSNESHITRGRNTLAAKFMHAKEYTHLFFIDADIHFDPVDALKMVHYDVDIICGSYPIKEVPPRYVVNFEMRDGKAWATNGLFEIHDGGTGFMCISRTVFEKMKAAFPELKYVPNMQPLQECKDECYSYFETMLDPVSKVWLSEDYAFCRRWQQIGGKVWLYPYAKLDHIGTYTFEGDVSKIIKWDTATVEEASGS